MALLDRFRSLPALKHPDVDVRLGYVEALPVAERDQLRSAALDDESPRVRRAAVGKLMDPPTLGRIAVDDPDPTVRAHASAMLRDIALEAFEEISEADSVAAVDAMTDAKMLLHVARTAVRPTVAERAFARIADRRALVSLARRAAAESVRRAAFDRLSDREELLAVALNGSFKDTAVLAVDRLSDRADLEQIARRSLNRYAVKRARALLRVLDDAERSTVGRDEAESSRGPAVDGGRPEGGGPDVAATHQAADRASTAGAREAMPAADESETAGRGPEDSSSPPGALPPIAEPGSSDASPAAAEPLPSPDQLAERRARLLAAVVDNETAAGIPDLRSARRLRSAAHRGWRLAVELGPPDPDLAERFAKADVWFRQREEEAREADRRARAQALEEMRRFLERIEATVADAQLTVRAADRALREVRAALGRIPPLPSKADYDEVVGRLKAAQAALTPRLQELRELESWQRWANVGIQEQLCEKMEALKTDPDVERVVARMRDLQRQWREAADVPRTHAEALWRRFKTAHDEVWARCQEYFAAEAEQRAANLQKKLALCERAEALSESTRWLQTAEEIKALQAEWKSIGPVTRGQEKAVWERFRAACDRFFARRHEDLVQRKALWAENLAKKEALCERAEALAESTDWEAAAAELKRLQAEWKTIGPVRKSRSEAIWRRFRSACDRFFARYAERHQIARNERAAAREALCAELEAIAAGGEGPADLLGTVRGIRARWQQEIARGGIEPARAAALDDRFAAALGALVKAKPEVFAATELDPEANRRKMEMLVSRVEELAASVGGAPTGAGDGLLPATRLAAMLKEALAANTIGGRVDPAARLRAAADELRRAQAAWSRIGPVPEAARRPLAERFHRACRIVADAAGGSRGRGSGQDARR